jgi:hypothetical protein
MKCDVLCLLSTNAIGMKTKVKNYKHFWDKELDGLIRSRKAANRLKRAYDKTRQHDSELGKLLNESYKKRKQAVQHAIQNKNKRR